MPLDVDYVAARETINELISLLDSLPHEGREKICDDIEVFVEQMKAKYQPFNEEEKR